MSLLSWLRERIGGGEIKLSNIDSTELYSLLGEVHIRELAFRCCVNIVANAVSKCEFKTLKKGVEVKEKEYYLWNIQPNRNQNSTAFLHKLVDKLYCRNECLVLDIDGQLIVADSFTQREFALLDNIFTDVTVGDFTFSRLFNMSEVLYLKLSEQNMRQITLGLYESYGKLIAYGMKSYQKSRGNRGTLNISTMAQGRTDFKETVEKLLNERFKTFFNAENAVLPLFDGYTYTDLGSKTYSSEGTRDIRAMIDDVSDFTAKGFGIPPSLLRGDIQGTKDATTNFLTFCIDPLTDMLSEEINRKRNGYDGFISGTYLQIDTKAIKHIDLLDVSTAIDKLIASGAFCINDIRRLVGETVINEPYANEHFMTKNYAPASEVTNNLEGGETE